MDNTFTYEEISKQALDTSPAKKLSKYKNIQERYDALNKNVDKKSVLDSIDRPIRPLVIEMNRIGLITHFSCCGYSYMNEEEPKSHNKWAQVIFLNTNETAYKALEEAGKKTGWHIIPNVTNNNGELCIIQDIPASPWRLCDNLEEAIHDYELKLDCIINLTNFLKELPSAPFDGVIIRDGNEGRQRFYKNEWMVEPKQPATIIWKKKEEES